MEDFANKYIIWCSDELQEALLHPLDNHLVTQPVLFSFNFKKNLRLLNSTTLSNLEMLMTFFDSKIFSGTFNKIVNVFDQIDAIDIRYNESLSLVFRGSNNKRLLYIIEALNRVINDEQLKIDGYKNINDQNEVAVVGFSTIIAHLTINKNVYTKIIYNNRGLGGIILNFPFAQSTYIINAMTDEFKKILKIKHKFSDELIKSIEIKLDIYITNRTMDQKHMTCKKYDMQIFYRSFPDGPENIFDCRTALHDGFAHEYMLPPRSEVIIHQDMPSLRMYKKNTRLYESRKIKILNKIYELNELRDEDYDILKDLNDAGHLDAKYMNKYMEIKERQPVVASGGYNQLYHIHKIEYNKLKIN
jgi:hypothetical protein